MKYKKAQEILPNHIIDILQEYVDGEWLYIPRKNSTKIPWGEKVD